jgi:hypothetical protein
LKKMMTESMQKKSESRINPNLQARQNGDRSASS